MYFAGAHTCMHFTSTARMDKIHKVIISLGLIVIFVLLIRLIISKETAYTVEAEVQLIRHDPELRKQEIVLDQESQDHQQADHNQPTQ